MAITTSCVNNSMPEDLERKKVRINKTMDSLRTIRKNVKSEDIQTLINQYEVLIKDVKNYTAECNRRGIKKNNDKNLKSLNKEIAELKSKIPISISYAQAAAFMKNRCNEIGQTLMRSKTVKYNGTKLYMFLSVAKNGYICISSVSEIALEVLNADCGPSEVKIKQWNELN